MTTHWIQLCCTGTLLLFMAVGHVGCHSSRGTDGDTSIDTGEDPGSDPPIESLPDLASDPSPDGGGEDNCVVACLRAQWEGGRDCEREQRDCLATCVSFSDETCIWNCEDVWSMCCSDLIDIAMACGEACPCAIEYNACLDACGPGNPACYEACSDAFDACTSYDWDAMRACWDECDETGPNCLILCDPYEEADDPEGYGICMYECSIDDIDCHIDCM